MKSRILFLLITFFVGSITVDAQEENNSKNFGQVINIGFGYGYELPALDLKDRYGNNLEAMLSLELMNNSNWVFGVEGSMKFGTKVKEDVLEYLRIQDNKLLGADHAIAETYFRERGVYLGANIGKLFPLNNTNRSGIRASLGAGMLAHKVRIVDENNSMPQIFDDYGKIYDRLARGLALKQYLGYEFFGDPRSIHFKIGLEITEGFTKEIRAVQSALNQDANRLDMYIGIKGTWFLSFYSENYESPEIYY